MLRWGERGRALRGLAKVWSFAVIFALPISALAPGCNGDGRDGAPPGAAAGFTNLALTKTA